MEYVITADRPFQEIESQTIDALEQRGFVVQRTFSLGSAMAEGVGGNQPDAGYTVLMLYRPGPRLQPIGLVTLYGRSGKTVLKSLLTEPTTSEAWQLSGMEDVEAELAVALSVGGLDFCVHADGREDCIDPGQMVEGKAKLLQDPVCGKWFSLDQAHAAIEYEGAVYSLCCPLCQTEFERDPRRYTSIKPGGQRGKHQVDG
jgi:YHS domain-containing protein